MAPRVQTIAVIPPVLYVRQAIARSQYGYRMPQTQDGGLFLGEDLAQRIIGEQLRTGCAEAVQNHGHKRGRVRLGDRFADGAWFR